MNQVGKTSERFGRLVKSQSDMMFALGDLALELVCPGQADYLDSFAEAVGMNAATLRRYRRVSAAWPQDKREKRVSWSVHAILAAHPHRFTIIQNPPSKGWTCSAAREVMQEFK
ncbi:DUF6192 family protein [Streptomyces sp. CL12]|uniref:DUF6192 family protein n=1 Tax=Streptomyces sp. CL12 TaxID=3391744 RepID=UPI003A81147A